MSRSVLPISSYLGALATCVVATAAVASDLTIRGRLSNTFELNDNYGLRTGPHSGILGSYSSGFMNATYRTPTTRFILNGDLTYRKYFGPGASAVTMQETISDGLNMRFERDGKLLGDKDFAFFSYRRSDAALAQRDDLGFSTTTVKGDLLNYIAGVGSTRSVTAVDNLSGSLNYSKTTYSPASPNTTPFTSYSASGGWSHRASNTVDFLTSVSLGLSKYDNSANTQIGSIRATSGASIRLTDRLSVRGNAGVSVYKTEQNVAGPVVIVPDVNDPFNTQLFTPAPAIAGTVVGPLFDIGLNYRLRADTSMVFAASQGITPGTLGDLAKRTQFSVGVNHTINSLSSLTFATAYGIYEPPAGGTATDNFTTSASYSYRLAPEWAATATYIYRQIMTSNGTSSGTTASSNAVLLIISKEFTLKP